MKRKNSGSPAPALPPLKWPRQNFYFAYMGNKWSELRHLVPHIEDVFKGRRIEYVVEPFCGSAAVSHFLWGMQHAPKSVFVDGFFAHLNTVKTLKDYPAKIRFHINDSDNLLIGFLRYIPHHKAEVYEELQKDRYRNITKDEYYATVKPYVGKRDAPLPTPHNPVQIYAEFLLSRTFIYHSYGRFNPHRHKYPHYTRLQKPIAYDAFLTDNDHVNTTHADFMDILEGYEQHENALVFLDPPYYGSSAGVYFDRPGKKKCKKIYAKLRVFLQNCACAVIMTVEDTPVAREFFAPWIKDTYTTTYLKSSKSSSILVVVKQSPLPL